MWAWVWVILGSAAIWVFFMLRRANLPLSMGRNLIGGVSISLLIPLIGVAYTEFYLPSTVPEVLNISVHLDRASINKGHRVAYVPLSITVSNPQKVGAYILAAYYDVIGRKGSVSHRRLSNFQIQEESSAADYQAIRRYVKKSSLHLLQEGPIIVPGDWLEPGQSLVLDDTISVPVPTPYYTIQIICNLIVMRNDRATLAPSFVESGAASWDWTGKNVRTAPAWILDRLPASRKPYQYVEWHAPLSESYLQGLLTRPRVVTVWYILPTTSADSFGPELFDDVSVAGAPSKAPASGDYQSAFDHYGLSILNGTNISKATLQLKIPMK
jgi:hypothetical protein